MSKLHLRDALRDGQNQFFDSSDSPAAQGHLAVPARSPHQDHRWIRAKSRAGTRRIAIPDRIAEILAEHIEEYVAHEADALIFTGPTGRPMRRSNFNKSSRWKAAAAGVGVPLLHFHDLRHTGNTFAASTPGASTRDLMERMGHDSMQAALIYQHRTRGADRRIASSLDDRLPAVIARGSHAVDLDEQRRARRGPESPLGRGFLPGAGDENRTRTVSLGS
ncbi:MAG: tyrosine-type recombinase/integrase [Jatrophihabitans sp.]